MKYDQSIMTLAKAADIADDTDALATAIDLPFDQWAHRCHSISLAVLRTGRFGQGRIARGACQGVGGQHSWIILGTDPYETGSILVDCTLWSYDSAISGIHVARYVKGSRYAPHGATGSIWTYGKPSHCGGETVALTPAEPLSRKAAEFLEILGPLDRQGWGLLAHAPVSGWPAAEIIAAMDDTQQLRALVPVDIVGMLTDRNPGDLYF